MMRHISTGWFTFIILPLFMLLTGCNSEEGSGSVTVKSGSAVTLERIDITPSPLRTRGVSQLQLAAGNELPFHAIGHYSDGSSRTLMGLSVNGLSESDTHLSDWHTSEQEVAVFSAPGMLKGGKTPGLVKVNLIKDNITSNTVKVNVTAAVIEDITITPASIALAKGQTEPLTAMATYSDGTTSDVTTSVAWQSPSPSTANVTPTGLISGADVGITTITATKDGVPSNTVNVHVTTAVIDDITITPANVSVAKGQTQPLTATAIYSDGSSSNISSSVAWQDDSPSTATPTVTITPTGVLSGVDVGTANLSATKDGVPSNTVNVNVTAAVIEGITITPASIALAKGQTEPLTAMATYSDGTTSDVTTSVAWQSPSPSTANVTPTGLISGGDVGITTITATKDGVPSNTVNVHVTTAVIDDITITPANVSVAKGQTQPLTATAIYSDGSSSNITNSVAWQSDSPSTATPTVTITPTGVLSGVDVGTANLSATKDGVPSNTVNVNVTAAVIEGITITPASIALAKGQTEPLTAMATYSDGTTSDVTTSVAWQSPSPSTANVTPTGLISGADVGITTITATKDGVPSNTVNVHVTTAVIDDITITPASVSVAKGQTQPLTATAIYSDGSSSNISSSVAWQDDSPSTATPSVTITPTGVLSGVDVGTANLSATKDGVPSNTVNVNVTAAVIEGITITPASIALAKGQTEPLTAMATYSDGTTSDVTTSVAWQSPSPSTANVTPTGLISGGDVGITTITATKDGVPSNTVNVHVTTAVIDDITITPANVSVAKGQTQPLTATAIYSDGSSSNISSSVAWQDDSPSTATPTVTITPTGVLSGVDVGTANLSATKDGVPSNTVNVNVTAAVIEDITITPASIALAKGQTEPLTAMATYSDGTTSDVTTSVAWQSPSPSTANVTPTGLISGGDVGITTITATKDGVPSNTVNVHVTTAVIDDITITPANVSVAKGQTQPLTATAIYSDGSSSNITSSVAWQSDSPSATPTVTITPTGVLSGVDVGTANLSATKDGVPSNTVNVNVTAAVIEDITITPASIALAKGQTEPLTAMATYSDGTTSDVTTSVAWQSPSPSTANVTPTGLISGGNVGITTITATKDGVPSNTVNVHVTIAVIDDITITPANVSVAKGQTQPLTAMATYSDGTTSDVTSSVAWSVSRPTTTSVATVTSGGLVSGVDMGVVTVTAMKDGVPSNDVDINVTAAVIDAINITPARLSVIMKGSSKPLTAMATYSDGTTSDVTSSVAWQSYPTATANVTPTGLVSGVKVGTASVSATKDGVSSNTITVEVCTLADACIDVFDTGSGKLFTHSPSVNYLYSIGGSPTDGFFTETGSSGPAGKFYRFNWSNAGLLCAKYNTESLSGRTNWRLPTKDELKVELYDKSGNMFTARSWPSSFQYWSATTNTGSTSTSYYTVGLKNGQTSFDYPTYAYYVSCVSTP